MNLSEKQNDQRFFRKCHSLYALCFALTKLGKGQARGRWESSRACSVLCPYFKKITRYRTEVEKKFGTTAAHRVSTQPWEIQAPSVPELGMNLAYIYLACFLFTVPTKGTNPRAVTARTPHCGSSAEVLSQIWGKHCIYQLKQQELAALWFLEARLDNHSRFS